MPSPLVSCLTAYIIGVLAGLTVLVVKTIFFKPRVVDNGEGAPPFDKSKWPPPPDEGKGPPPTGRSTLESVVLGIWAVMSLCLMVWVIYSAQISFVLVFAFIVWSLIAFLVVHKVANLYLRVLLVTVLSACLVLAALCIIPPGCVTLECRDSVVEPQDTFEGYVCKPEWHVRILVHAYKASGYYVQQEPTRDGRGRFSAQCHFGGSSGDRFDVMAIAGKDLREFRTGQIVQDDDIGPDLKRSQICSVVLE